MATKTQKKNKQKLSRYKKLNDKIKNKSFTIDEIFSEDAEYACLALMQEVSNVLCALEFRQVNVEIRNTEKTAVVGLKANPKTEIVHYWNRRDQTVLIDRNCPEYKAALEKLGKDAEKWKPMVEAFNSGKKKLPKEVLIGRSKFELLKDAYNNPFYRNVKTYQSVYKKYLETPEDMCNHSLISRHPDNYEKAAWIVKPKVYCFGWCGQIKLKSNEPDHIAIVMAAGTKLLTALKPEEYKILNTIRDQYIASCLLGVTDITFNEKNDEKDQGSED